MAHGMRLSGHPRRTLIGRPKNYAYDLILVGENRDDLPS